MNNKYPRQLRLGFTLIELMIYLALVSGVLVAVTTFAWNIINSRTKAFAVQEVEQNSRLIMEKIVREVQQAHRIITPDTGGSSDSLTLTMRDGQRDPVIFSWSDGHVYLSAGQAEPLVLSSDQVIVTALRFQNLSTPDGRGRNIAIVLEVQHLNPARRQEWQAQETLTTAVELRDIY
jgi:type II secretory pathway pseudopilin PulG